MHLLDGKTCLVTGGADSIGLAAARLFLDHGARVALVDREPATSENLGDAYDAERMISLTADVSRAADTARYVKERSPVSARSTCCSPMPAISERWRPSPTIPTMFSTPFRPSMSKARFSPANTLIPLGRHGSADEIARSVLYLASDFSSFTTGATLMVDGGMSA